MIFHSPIAQWISWICGIILAIAIFSTTAICGASAFYTATDNTTNWFLPASNTQSSIVAFYCSNDKSINFASVDEAEITRDGPQYMIAGKLCDEYFNANEPLQFKNGQHSAFSACNRNYNSKTYPSKDPRIKKICFLTSIQPKAMQGWFCEIGRVDTVEGLDNLDSSRLTALDWCFSGSSGDALVAIARNLNTKSVTSLSHCFEDSHLEGFDLSGWNTLAMRDMTCTFARATGAHLDLSAWDVSAVQKMDEMFHGAFMQYYRDSLGLESIDHQASCTEEWWQLNLAGWQPKALRSYKDMFYNCCVKEVDLSGFENIEIHQNPGLEASYLRRITVGPGWTWANVKSGSTPWFSWDTKESYGPWDDGTESTPPDHKADTYDRSCLLAVRYNQTMTVYDVLQTTADGADSINGNKVYQVFQRYNAMLCDEAFEIDHKRPYSSAEELAWAEATTDITNLVFASDITPISIDHWFDGFSNCTTFDLRKIDSRQCAPTTALFAQCFMLQTINFGPHWAFAESKEAETNLPEGTWYSDAGEYRATDPLPVPGLYHRMNPVAFMTKDKVLHLANGKQSIGATFEGQQVMRIANLGFTWLQDTEPHIPWTSWNYQSVVVETPLAPVSCLNWFGGSSPQKANLALLDTTNCSTMVGLFDGCESLIDITIGDTFSFIGDGSQSFYLLPGTQWTCLKTGASYIPSQIPNRTAGRYTRGLEWQALLVESPADTKTLRFQLCPPTSPGDTVEDGGTVTNVYTGFAQDTYSQPSEVPWAHQASQIHTVEITDSLAPQSANFWFNSFSACTNMNLTGLDTRNCFDMRGLFNNCAPSSIELGASFSFEGCTNTRLCNLPAGVWKGE